MRAILLAAVSVAALAYVFKGDNAAPSAPVSTHGLVVAQNGDHQCYIEARVNGVPLRFLIDTGAWMISFGSSHLATLGIDPRVLVYDQRVSTANGIGRAANIRLSRLEVAGLTLRDVPAQVDQRGTDALLGASVLRHLKLEFGSGVCVLTPAARGGIG